MSDLKFACPNCQQHIQCEPGYAGMEIACPACHSKMIVPGGAPAPIAAMSAPAPVQAPGLRISSSATAAPPAPAPTQMTGAEGGPTCPNCGNPVAPRAIVCIKCGTNIKTGQKVMPGSSRPGARPAMVAAAGPPTVWYKTVYPYLGAYFAVLLVFYFMGGGFKLLCGLGILLYIVAAKITVTVFAFKDDGAGKGFLCLCIDIYTIYYVFKVSERQLSKVLYGIVCVMALLFKIISYFNLANQ